MIGMAIAEFTQAIYLQMFCVIDTTDCVARYLTRANISPRDISREMTRCCVLSDTETESRAVLVSCDVLTRSDAFFHPQVDKSAESRRM